MRCHWRIIFGGEEIQRIRYNAVTMICTYCKEEIRDGALKCRYCHEWLDGRWVEMRDQGTALVNRSRTIRTVGTIVACVCLTILVVIVLFFGVTSMVVGNMSHIMHATTESSAPN